MSHDKKQSAAWYALRRPLPPWRFDELLAEMVEHLPRYRVDEVIVMVDVEEFFHNHPTPQVAREYQKNLIRVRDALAGIGVAYSLNPWITRGHEDRGRRAADVLPGIQTVIHADGSQATCVACNLSPAWRENLRQVWHIYAQTHPRVLWIDDDIRDFAGHECFCPRHLQAFSDRVATTVTRQQLADAILQPGAPHPWRGEWLAMRAEMSLEVLQMIAGAAHAAAPETCMGLMSSGPRNHCREGRDWFKVAAALGATKERPIYSRPTLGNYWEWGPPRGLYFSQDSAKLTRHCLPPETIDHSELESVPFSRYSKSIAFTFAQLAVSVAYGCRGTTFDIFDFIGTPMEAEPHYGRMLAARKDFLNALAAKAQLPGAFRGVQLLHRPDASAVKHLAQGDSGAALIEDGYPALEAFEAAGIPTTYDPSDVAFLTGQQPRALADEEIRTLLTRGVFLDATAAHILCQRGFAADLGLVAMQTPAPLEKLGAFSVEDLSNPVFGGAPRAYMSAQMPMVSYNAKFAVMQPLPQAITVSTLNDPDAQPVHPAMTAFQNQQGGRIVIHAWDYASSIGPIGISFHNPVRQTQLQHAVRWLFGGRPPLLARGDGVWPLAFRRDCADGTVLGFFNLSLDAWPEVELEFSALHPITGIAVLESEGRWQPLDVATCQITAGKAKLPVRRSVPLDQPLVLWITWRIGETDDRLSRPQ
jgi:hypothetical protein